MPTVMAEVATAKRQFGLSDEAPVVSCYEAGRDGFWLHRCLAAQGVTNYVVDSASIEINRRARRQKTDALDVRSLLHLLARYTSGDRQCWKVVRVPTVAEEDARQLHRTWITLQHDRTRLVNRVKAMLASQGVQVRLDTAFLERLTSVRLWDGSGIPPATQQRIARDWAQLQVIEQQLAAVDAARAALNPDLTSLTGRAVSTLQRLQAIGPVGAWLLATEIFGWRAIRNARELGALVGLAPAVYQSGESQRDLGITHAGNTYVRGIMVQLAWGWVRYQRHSALTQWYVHRFGRGGPRVRRIGIVALARKLLIALWRSLETGVVPEGATLKAIAA
jgi:transposase